MLSIINEYTPVPDTEKGRVIIKDPMSKAFKKLKEKMPKPTEDSATIRGSLKKLSNATEEV